NRDLNYDKYFVEGEVITQDNEAYTSHNTQRLDVDGVVDKLMTLDYIKEELEHFGK
ncbi:MAG: UDP-glucose 4-epimerase, partial [Oscillospiraceae bacterium]|nr:UDP-glucose 4-epimerase [Oscillospiraceae bacterium]